MAYKLAVSSQKGGVGKSTTSVNVAGGLAARGYDVLAVDGDPQGGLTLKLGYRDRYRDRELALYDVLAEQGSHELDDFPELVVADPEFDIVPAQMRNFLLEKSLYMDPRGVETMGMALDTVSQNYDFIVVDTPPNLGPLSDGSILATQRVLFPSGANEISRDSIWLLREEIRTLERKFECSVDSVGAILNEVPPRETIATEITEWFDDTFGSDNVFEVPDRAVIEHAISQRCSIYAYDPETAGYEWDTTPKAQVCECYDAIVDRLEQRP